MPALDFKVYVPATYVAEWEKAGGDIEDLPKTIRQRVKDMLDIELKVLTQTDASQVVVPESESSVTPAGEAERSLAPTTPAPPPPVLAVPKPDPPPLPPVIKARPQGRLGMDPKYRKEVCVHRVSPASYCKICDANR